MRIAKYVLAVLCAASLLQASCGVFGLAVAQISLGKRVIADAEALVTVAANLPTIIDKAGDKAVACVGASASMTTFAATSLGVVVDASVDVSVKVGVGG